MKKITLLATVAMIAMVVLGVPHLAATSHRPIPLADLAGLTCYDKEVRTTNSMPEKHRTLDGYSIFTKAADEVSDLITDTPEGELNKYSRHGMCYGTRNGVTYETGEQDGLLSVVTAPDGKTVYLKELVSASAGMGGWIKGELSVDGQTITVPTGQKLAYLTTEKRYLSMYLLDYDKENDTFVIDETAASVTFSVDGKQILLNGTNEEKILGLVYSDDNSWSLYGDYESAYTLFEDKLVELPENLETSSYKMEASNSFGNSIATEIKIGYVGNDVYIQGMCAAAAPNGWVKGTKDADGNITIPNGQLTGFYKDFYPVYFMGENEKWEICDMVLNYDEATGTFSTGMRLYECTDKDNFHYIESYYGIKISKVESLEFSTEVIAEQPDGEEKVFIRSGSSFYVSDGGVYATPQHGYLMRIVYAPDGKTVYMKDAISQTSERTWIKGTIEGNKITVPLYQCVQYDQELKTGTVTAKLILDEDSDTFVPDFTAKEVTFTVDPATGVISLDGFDEGGNMIYGLITTGILQWNGYGDGGSVYTPFTEEKTVIPEHLDKQKWSFRYIRKYDNSYGFVDVALDGDKIYIAGLPKLEADAAIVGTIKDGKAVFESDQFICVLEEFDVAAYLGGTVCEYDEREHLTGYTYTPTFEMVYDSEKRTLTAEESTAMLFNGGKPSVMIQNILACINAKFAFYEEYAATPADPVFLSYDDYAESHGYVTFQLDIPIVDTEGGFINPAKMAYQIFTKKDGVESPFVFLASVYKGIDEDMEIIPYEFGDEYDIYVGGIRLYIYAQGIEDVAVQSINYSGGVEHRSNKIWHSESGAGVVLPESVEKEIVSVVFHDLNGIRVDNPDKGIYIKTVVYEDGTSKTTKTVKTE